jgi:tetratricopeptide (TPR) repeat protein
VTGVAAARIERAIAELAARPEPPGKKSESVARAVVPAVEAADPAIAAPAPDNAKPDARAPVPVAEQGERPAAALAFGEDAEVEAQKSATDPSLRSPAAGPVADRDPALARAEALEGEGRELRALEVLRAAAASESASSELLSRLTRALMKTGAWGEAQRSARRRAALDPSADARLELARVERAMGNRERALELVKEVLKDPAAPAEAKNLLSSLAPGSHVALRD